MSSVAYLKSNILHKRKHLYGTGVTSANVGWNNPTTNAPHKVNSCPNTSSDWGVAISRSNISGIDNDKIYSENGNVYDMQGNVLSKWDNVFYNPRKF